MPSKRSDSIIRLVLVLLTFLTAGRSISANDRVQWEPVDGADHYRVEIRQAGELFLETRSDNPWLPLFLPPGEYEFQVRVMNAFGKVSSQSDWSPLSILAPSIPFIIDMTPREINDGGVRTFHARVSGYLPEEEDSDGSAFHLSDADGKTIAMDISGVSAGSNDDGSRAAWSEITMDTGRKDPEVGSWTLVMTNPDGRYNSMEAALSVLDNLRPRIKNVSPREIPAGEVHNALRVEIGGLEEDAAIGFDGPSPVQATLLNRPKPGVLEYSLNLKDAETGWYSISVKNPSGGEDFKGKAWEVLPRPLTDEEIAALNALKVDEKEPLPLPEHPHSIYIGWNVNIPFGETLDFYNNDFAGLSLGYAQSFHNDLFRKLRLLNGLGWEAAYVYSNHLTNYPLYEIRLNRHQFLFGLTYATPFDFPMNLFLRASSGMGLSYYNSPERDRGEDLGGFTLGDLDSWDYVMRFGGGIRFSLGRRWYADAACDVSATFYLSRTAWSVQPKIEGGWRW